MVERVVKSRLTDHLTSNKLLNPHQSTYCKHHSTRDPERWAWPEGAWPRGHVTALDQSEFMSFNQHFTLLPLCHAIDPRRCVFGDSSIQRQCDARRCVLRPRRRWTASLTRCPAARRSSGASSAVADRRGSRRPVSTDTGLLQRSAVRTPATDGRIGCRTSAFSPAPVSLLVCYCSYALTEPQILYS